MSCLGVVYFICFLPWICCPNWVCGFIVLIKYKKLFYIICPPHNRTPITHILHHSLLFHRLTRLRSSFLVFFFLLHITVWIVSIVLSISKLIHFTMSNLLSSSSKIFLLCIIFVSSRISILFFFMSFTSSLCSCYSLNT